MKINEIQITVMQEKPKIYEVYIGYGEDCSIYKFSSKLQAVKFVKKKLLKFDKEEEEDANTEND
jgi:hypothetical protein